eukprot:6296128-Prymnesium_polylepis.1
MALPPFILHAYPGTHHRHKYNAMGHKQDYSDLTQPKHKQKSKHNRIGAAAHSHLSHSSRFFCLQLKKRACVACPTNRTPVAHTAPLVLMSKHNTPACRAFSCGARPWHQDAWKRCSVQA